jgi:hypothetical protein
VRDHGQRLVAYSWQFVGGTGWSASSAYTPVVGGRYQHVVPRAPNDASPITTVQVTDASGAAHDVALRPALSIPKC